MSEDSIKSFLSCWLDMTKRKINVTIDPDNLERAKALVKTGRYRNISHVFDLALAEFLERESQGDKASRSRR